MIIDRIENARQYLNVHPLMGKVLDFLSRTDLAGLPLGRHEIEGGRLFLLTARFDGKGRSGARLEAHRKYIDIQISLDRPDDIGYKATDQCRLVSEPYDDEKDVEFFSDAVESWITVVPGSFAVFFPADAHAPLAVDGQVHKAVFKLAVDGK
ncbi:MAG: YhcH/YjgK/YiaL family protein [Planctomycetes bacterium]|nr:YhcH/YjgK/YiaL family protein [Planctomycetota bacterium]